MWNWYWVRVRLTIFLVYFETKVICQKSIFFMWLISRVKTHCLEPVGLYYHQYPLGNLVRKMWAKEMRRDKFTLAHCSAFYYWWLVHRYLWVSNLHLSPLENSSKRGFVLTNYYELKIVWIFRQPLFSVITPRFS